MIAMAYKYIAVILMFILTKLEYVLIYQVKEKKTNVVLKMLLKKRA